MKGDFSKSNGHPSRTKTHPGNNFSGVLHQQGRVLLDRDWNEQTEITTHWQDQAGRDVIGPEVAAVPAGEPDGVRVRSASLDPSGPAERVRLDIRPGRVWADGLLVHLTGENPDPTGDVSRIATYLEQPVQEPPRDPSTIDEGVRDAVILEVWREALNGFQVPDTLIEPALGGPDTTERVLTSMRFRLFRLGPRDTCPHIQDDFVKGKLNVALRPSTTIPGDCPVEEGGGYVGFEHFLYRIEIAQVDDPQPMFKWSQFNGGLVGRGLCDLGGADKKIAITANDQAIKMSGPSSFYLEVVELDSDQGFWRVTYGAEATLNGDELEVTQEHYTEAARPGGTVFFRLWNEIRPISGFPKVAAPAEPNELRDGIRLAFDPPGAANYRAGDYWSFQVRAGEVFNPDPLIDDQPPQGVRYHRVPLAILNWNDNKAAGLQEIEDCRDVFHPLTKQGVCCSFTVGDGRSSHGDFDSIGEALRHLPDTGGEVCLLPGLHQANVVIQGKRDIKIKGCDKRTRVVPEPQNRLRPIFGIVDSEAITLEHMDLVTLGGRAIHVVGTEPDALKDVAIHNNRILAYKNAILVVQATGVVIHHNTINMLDREGAGVAVYMMAEDSVIERNIISVVPAEARPSPDDFPVDVEIPDPPTDPCADLEVVYENGPFLFAYAHLLWGFLWVSFPERPFEAAGGIQIAGGSEGVQILENKVQGGAGNGITLGSDASAPDGEDPTEPTHTISHRRGQLWGMTVAAGSAVGGIALLFTGSDATSITQVTDGEGFFRVTADPGDYAVSVKSPGYKIESIDIISDDSESPLLYHHPESPLFCRINLVKDEDEPGEDLAFIYEIRVDRNEISRMDSSGIGIPRIAAPDDRGAGGFTATLARLRNPVVNLAIHRNHIFDCLQNPFDRALSAEAQNRGFGGVALGMCGSLSIHENRIENNGTTHVGPTCGLYLAYGERIEITHNTILDNGPVSASSDDPLRPGIRGGIVLGIASSLPILNRLAKRGEVLSGASPAARVHDNIVEQPAGQALRITAFGPVSVLGNYFRSELSGTEVLDFVAGAVLIRNVWQSSGIQARAAARANISSATLVNWGRVNGNILFNGNQTLVGANNGGFTSQLILSMEDIGFDGNQSDNLKNGFLSSNTLLVGATLRASDNRLKELGDERRPPASLLTLTAMLNNTTNNQGNHCIVAFNQDPQRPAIAQGNQVLHVGARGCDVLEKEILDKGDELLSTILRGIGMLEEID
jgi:hypothetical protein